jgi:hypothetical protein
LLIHLDILDPERDVELWLGAIKEFCQNQRFYCFPLVSSFDLNSPLHSLLSGRLTRGDILAFAESYRRKFLSLDNKSILTPPATATALATQSTGSQFPRKLSPTSRTIYSPVSNYQSSAYPTAATTAPGLGIESPIKDDRTPLLPINSQAFRQQQSLSESPLTLGKKSSYGLFIPPNYQTAVAHSPGCSSYHGLGNSILYEEAYDEEASSL